MRKKVLFLIFIFMLGLLVIPSIKPKAATYTGGYTVNVYFGTGYLANERVDFYNNSTKISSLNPYINPSTGESGYYCYKIEQMGWTNHSINNVTDLTLMGGDDMYSVSVDGTTEEFSWGTSYEYELTSDINLYLNVSEKSNNNTIESVSENLSYNVNIIIEDTSSRMSLDALRLMDTSHTNIIQWLSMGSYASNNWSSQTFSNVYSVNFDAADSDSLVILAYGEEVDISMDSKEYILDGDVNIYLDPVTTFNENEYAVVLEYVTTGYSLTYVIDGVEETVSSLTTVPTLSTPTKEGFLFDGWYYEDTYETKVKEGDSLTSDTIIYAKFNQLYDINFVVKYNGVELRQIDPITNVTEIPGNLPNPDEDDYLTFYEFRGWYLDEAFTSGITEGIQLGRDITLYAKLEPISYTLSFVTNTDLISLDPVQITGESMMTIGTLPVLYHENFDFLGWYYEEDFTTQVQETDCLIEDTIIYAKLGNYKYLLSYVTGLEEYDSYYIDSINNSFVTFPYWSYETFECLGWYYDDERTIKATEGDLLTSDTILYAKISQKKYILSFDSKGGNEIQSMTCTNIFLEEDQPVPTKQGYTFVGWYYDNYSWHEPVIYNDILTDHITLYAKWEKQTFNLVYTTDGSPVESTVIGFIPNPIPISIKDGYTFDGWYYDQEYTNKALPGDEINEDTTVYAKFRLSYNGVIDDITNGDSISMDTLEYILVFGAIAFILLKIIRGR